RRLALREGGKNFALSVFERLQIADHALATAGADGVASDDRRFLSLYFSEVEVHPAPAPVQGDPAVPVQPAAGAAEAPARLRVSQAPGGQPQLMHADGDRLLVGTLDPAFLWGRSEEHTSELQSRE